MTPGFGATRASRAGSRVAGWVTGQPGAPRSSGSPPGRPRSGRSRWGRRRRRRTWKPSPSASAPVGPYPYALPRMACRARCGGYLGRNAARASTVIGPCYIEHDLRDLCILMQVGNEIISGCRPRDTTRWTDSHGRNGKVLPTSGRARDRHACGVCGHLEELGGHARSEDCVSSRSCLTPRKWCFMLTEPEEGGSHEPVGQVFVRPAVGLGICNLCRSRLLADRVVGVSERAT